MKTFIWLTLTVLDELFGKRPDYSGKMFDFRKLCSPSNNNYIIKEY